jgi:hypothetical protein
MATRWMKWNEGTHIFEYSTDGVTFNPLPLDASILTQGTINPARLPPGLPSGGGDNIFTGLNTISNAAPALRFNETDAVVNLKNWDIGVNAGNLSIRTLDDAYATPINLLSINRSGVLSVNAIGAGDHVFSGDTNTNFFISLANINAGVSANAGINFRNDVGNYRAHIVITSAGNTNPAFVADGLNLFSQGVGGINLCSYSASPITFRVANVTRMTLNSLGNVVFSGVVVERGRNNAMGDWIPVGFLASNFSAQAGLWTLTAGDQIMFQYTLIGKTMIITFYFGTSTVTVANSDLRVLIPGGFTANGYYENQVRVLNAGVRKTGIAFTSSNGSQVIQFAIQDATNWAVQTDTAYVIGQIVLGIN